MANVLYPAFKEALLTKAHDLSADAIMVSLIDGADYTYDATDKSYVAGADGVADVAKIAAVQLTSLTKALGVFDSADWSWLAVTGDPAEIVMLWNDTPTTPVADPLVAFYDAGIAGVPITPNGGNINGTVHASGWFAL